MPSLIDIRRRIRAVKSTQQITKAMKMVAASRLRRAQDRMLAFRPFSRQALRVLNSVAARVDPSAHPLLEVRDEQAPGSRTLLVVITADRGLCGSFNTNIIKAASAFMVDRPGREFTLGLIGRKGRDYFVRRGFAPSFEMVNIFSHLDYGQAQGIAKACIESFTGHECDAVYLVFNEFKSVLQQRVVVDRLLPVPRLEGFDQQDPAARVEYLYEPDPQRIFNALLPRYVEVQIYHALIESSAAEEAARMSAMDTATENSGEIIDQLTLYMNKVRQAAITREIIEVVSGAQAL
jgi:F-type H+-transporting ATPase subunit gamma